MNAFNDDYGHETGHDWDYALNGYRAELETLLGQFSAEGQNNGGGAKNQQTWAGSTQGSHTAGYMGSGY